MQFYACKNVLYAHMTIHSTFNSLLLHSTGAFLTHVSVLWSWFWIGSYWVLVLIMYQRPSRGHIHHFFIKAALPCYGIPLVAAITCIVVASSLGHNTANRNSTVSYSSQRYVERGSLLSHVHRYKNSLPHCLSVLVSCYYI